MKFGYNELYEKMMKEIVVSLFVEAYAIIPLVKKRELANRIRAIRGDRKKKYEQKVPVLKKIKKDLLKVMYNLNINNIQKYFIKDKSGKILLNVSKALEFNEVFDDSIETLAKEYPEFMVLGSGYLSRYTPEKSYK